MVERDGLGGVYTGGKTSGFNEERSGLCILAEGSSVMGIDTGVGVTGMTPRQCWACRRSLVLVSSLGTIS